ncbi:MAG: Fe-S cluster assembly ATPase SufC [Pseudobacteriovorax sp.]|nr:Fe-S cluster assembly ATPase SufC [Pseudobacteriovorax sp.]
MLNISGLKAKVGDIDVLKGLDLSVSAGEIHAIMGPNGSGKSTLGKVLSGHPEYDVVSGDVNYEVNFKNKDITTLSSDERAKEGIFLSFQYPVEIPGVPNEEFLRASFNALCKHQGVEEMSAEAFADFVRSKAKDMKVDESFLTRDLNVDLSGGEKKRNELLQMAVLSPRLSILDEIDSGLDIDSLKIVGEGVNKLRNEENSFVLITHYQRLLNYIEPDFVHVLHDGKIIKTGDKTLALEIEDKGYDWLI